MRRLSLLVVGVVVAGCGGRGHGDSGVKADFRSRVESEVQFAMRSISTQGEIDFGLTFKPDPDFSSHSTPVFNEPRGVWMTSTTAYDSPEGPDGVSSTYRVQSRADFYTDASKSATAGTRTYYFYQGDYEGTETTTIRESLTSGKYAGYSYRKDLVVELGTMNYTGETVATHPSWGEMKSVYQLWGGGFTLTHTNGEHSDRFFLEEAQGRMEATLYDGTNFVLEPEDGRSGTGTITSPDHQVLGTVTWTDDSITVHWQSGEVRSMTFW